MHIIVEKIPSLKRWSIAIKIIPLMVFILILKFLAHYFNLEVFELNSLFTALISTNVFLISFLITGVLSDYKESEKIPGDLASSLETLADEGEILYKNTKQPISLEYLNFLKNLNKDIIDWFHKRVKTAVVLEKVKKLNFYFARFEEHTQANFISRLKQEQNNLRRMINRVHTIRDTSFLGTGYAIVEIITFLAILGLIFVNIDPSNANPNSFRDSLFLVLFISFLFTYMINLIKDLDNPFSYYEKDNLAEDVSLKPILEVSKRIDSTINDLKN